MPAKVQVTVTDQQKQCEFTKSFFDTYREPLKKNLDEMFRPDVPEGQEMPDVLATVDFVLRCQDRSLQTMLAAEQAHLDEVANDAAVREARQEAASELRTAMFDMREFSRRVYGRAETQKLGFEDRLAQDPVALARQGKRILGNLRDPELELPASRYEELPVTAEFMASMLEPGFKKLVELNGAITRERTGLRGSVVVKNQAVAEHKVSYRLTVHLLQGLYRLAGLPDLAERLELHLRRRSGRPTTAGESSQEQSNSPPEAVSDETSTSADTTST